eukprot:Pgem_evm1s11348
MVQNPSVGVQFAFYQENSMTPDGRRIRHRRTFKQLSREVACPVDKCGRLYATKSSLATHMRLKHPQNGNLDPSSPQKKTICESIAKRTPPGSPMLSKKKPLMKSITSKFTQKHSARPRSASSCS